MKLFILTFQAFCFYKQYISLYSIKSREEELMENKYNTKKKTITIVCIVTMITLCTLLISFRSTVEKTIRLISQKIKPTEHTMIIFTHGTFGSILGLLDAQNVLKDTVSGSKYKKIIRRQVFELQKNTRSSCTVLFLYSWSWTACKRTCIKSGWHLGSPTVQRIHECYWNWTFNGNRYLDCADLRCI